MTPSPEIPQDIQATAPAMTNTVTVQEPSLFFLSQIADNVQTLKRFKEFHPAYRPEPSIKCGDVKRLWREIERVTGRVMKDDDNARPISSMQFMGVPVVESSLIPKSIVVIMMGDEVVDIINLDKSRAA